LGRLVLSLPYTGRDRYLEYEEMIKLLGANIASNKNLKEEVTTKANTMSAYLRDILGRRKYMSLKNKIRIMKLV
jgi:hypothetical protein